MQPFKNIDAAKKAAVQVKSFTQSETHRGVAWSCMVYLEGRKLGQVSNDGTGAMIRVDFSADQQKQIVDALKASGYELVLVCGDTVFDEPDSVESWFELAIGQIGDESAQLKSLKRRTKTRIIVESRTEPHLAFFKATDTPENRVTLQRQLGANLVRFLNDTILAC